MSNETNDTSKIVIAFFDAEVDKRIDYVVKSMQYALVMALRNDDSFRKAFDQIGFSASCDGLNREDFIRSVIRRGFDRAPEDEAMEIREDALRAICQELRNKLSQ